MRRFHGCREASGFMYQRRRRPRRRHRYVAGVVAVFLLCGFFGTKATEQASSSTIDMTSRSTASKVVWLCRPGLERDPCKASLTTTVVSGIGGKRIVNYQPARHPKIDCFYVYPDISAERGPNANLTVQPQERAIAELEASPFSRDCRVFAPMYRDAIAIDSVRAWNKAYASVLSAWRVYLAKYNDGRGVVLIGHSEGADLLVRLLSKEINPNPTLRGRLVSAILTGTSLNENLVVGPNGAGPFSRVPVCHAPSETGCVIGYNAFTKMPTMGAYFGTPNTKQRGDVELCTNPAALAGGSGALVPMYRVALPTELVAGSVGYDAPMRVIDPPKVTTPWVEFVHDYTGRCARGPHGTDVLIVTATSRAPSLTEVPSTAEGLHVDDPNLALENLVNIVGRESSAYLGAR